MFHWERSTRNTLVTSLWIFPGLLRTEPNNSDLSSRKSRVDHHTKNMEIIKCHMKCDASRKCKLWKYCDREDLSVGNVFHKSLMEQGITSFRSVGRLTRSASLSRTSPSENKNWVSLPTSAPDSRPREADIANSSVSENKNKVRSTQHRNDLITTSAVRKGMIVNGIDVSKTLTNKVKRIKLILQP